MLDIIPIPRQLYSNWINAFI